MGRKRPKVMYFLRKWWKRGGGKGEGERRRKRKSEMHLTAEAALP